MFEISFKPYGDRAILVEWPQEINEPILYDLLDFKNKLDSFYGKQSVQINSAYNSILITYDNVIDNYNEVIVGLKTLYESDAETVDLKGKLWEIPVCYDKSLGIDLEEMSQTLGLSENEIIAHHSKTIYTVYFIGFLPGFLYLGGLDKKLYCPRKSTPRLKVDKGAVGIGGKQTGIYPMESPGGWNIIGSSPLRLFDPQLEVPCSIAAGDKVNFLPVSLDEYHSIQKKVDNNLYELKYQLCHD